MLGCFNVKQILGHVNLVTSCFNQRNDVNSENVNSENECEEVQENLRNKIESENQKEIDRLFKNESDLRNEIYDLKK